MPSFDADVFEHEAHQLLSALEVEGVDAGPVVGSQRVQQVDTQVGTRTALSPAHGGGDVTTEPHVHPFGQRLGQCADHLEEPDPNVRHS